MGARIRAALVTISSAPWRRAPWLLRRRPGVLATMAAASAVVAASLASVPLFLSSVGTESVELQVDERCPRDTGATFSFAPTPDGVRTRGEDPFGPIADRLGPSNRWVRLEGLALPSAYLVGADPAEDTRVSLIVRDGALDHVEVLERSGGPGVWIPDRATDQTGLRAGDVGAIRGVPVPIAGVYRDLAGTTVDDYWCSNADLLLLESLGADLKLPPPMLIMDADTFAGLMTDLDIDRAEGGWEAPLRDDLTVTDTRALVRTLACRGEDSPALRWCTGGQPPLAGTPTVGYRGGPIEAPDDAEFVERFLDSHLPFVTDRSRAIQTSVGGGVWPMAGFAALAGMGLVAASASLWFDRRRREVTLLTVRGVSPAGIGLKAVLELSLALVVGVAAGVAIAHAIVVRLGPSAVLEPVARRHAAVAGGLALLAAAVVVGGVVAQRVRGLAGRSRRRLLRFGLVPWELGLGWVTLVAYRRLGDWGIPVGRGADVSRVDVWGLLFPVLFLVTGIAVLSRLLTLATGPVRAASRSWPTALYLGVRRVARYRVAVVGLVAASAIAAGVLGYATTMNRSLDATLQAKARTFVGSDTAVRVPADDPIVAALADRTTEVHVYWRAWINDGQRKGVAVVAIDPATFERAGYWDASFSDASLREILDRLAAVPADGPVPAIVLGTPVEGTAEVGIVTFGTDQLTVQPLAGVEAFPGTKRGKPTVFVAAAALEGLDVGSGSTEAWIRGDRADTEAALAAAGTGFEEERNLTEVADSASFLTVSWTFGFMQSLGIAAGLLALGGVAVYLDARRRDRLLGFSFMVRMGLTRRQHRRALAVELVASVLVGCWVGLATALAAAWLAYGSIDPVPGFRPDPVLRLATAVVATVAALAVAVTVVAALLAQRRVDRGDPVEVLRAGV